MVSNLHPYQVLDTQQFFELRGANDRIGILDHESRLEIPAAGDQRVVSLEFLVDTVCFKYFLDAQHFLDLVEQGESILEIKGRVWSKGNLAVFLVQ